LRCTIDVALIFASAKEITSKFLVWENTTREELQPLELTSKVTTEFAYNGTSRGIDVEASEFWGCKEFLPKFSQTCPKSCRANVANRFLV